MWRRDLVSSKSAIPSILCRRQYSVASSSGVVAAWLVPRLVLHEQAITAAEAAYSRSMTAVSRVKLWSDLDGPSIRPVLKRLSDIPWLLGEVSLLRTTLIISRLRVQGDIEGVLTILTIVLCRVL